LLAAVIAPAAVFFTAGGDVHPFPTARDAHPAVDAAPCCLEIVRAQPIAFSPVPPGDQAAARSGAGHLGWASRLRVVERHIPRLLPVGIAPEMGLQVNTILVARTISAMFPEIHSIGGVRPDALRWHPEGLALDVTIPSPDSAGGIALGDRIVAFVLENANRFGLQDAIWRGVYYTPDGPTGHGYGHYDHVHITTTGGGYPTGTETYLG
jgi:hypothetical protein